MRIATSSPVRTNPYIAPGINEQGANREDWFNWSRGSAHRNAGETTPEKLDNVAYMRGWNEAE